MRCDAMRCDAMRCETHRTCSTVHVRRTPCAPRRVRRVGSPRDSVLARLASPRASRLCSTTLRLRLRRQRAPRGERGSDETASGRGGGGWMKRGRGEEKSGGCAEGNPHARSARTAPRDCVPIARRTPLLLCARDSSRGSRAVPLSSDSECSRRECFSRLCSPLPQPAAISRATRFIMMTRRSPAFLHALSLHAQQHCSC